MNDLLLSRVISLFYEVSARNPAVLALDTPIPRATDRRPVTAPDATAMMQPTIDALNDRGKAAESRVAALEARIKDLEATAIPVACISPNPWQPRKMFAQADIEKLANSINEIGLLQPIISHDVPLMLMDCVFLLPRRHRRPF